MLMRRAWALSALLLVVACKESKSPVGPLPR